MKKDEDSLKEEMEAYKKKKLHDARTKKEREMAEKAEKERLKEIK